MLFRDNLTGWPGSVHDSRVLRNSSLHATAAIKFLGDTHFLGDGEYPLKRYVLSEMYVSSNKRGHLTFLFDSCTNF